jgi:hypothetical protein
MIEKIVHTAKQVVKAMVLNQRARESACAAGTLNTAGRVFINGSVVAAAGRAYGRRLAARAQGAVDADQPE